VEIVSCRFLQVAGVANRLESTGFAVLAPLRGSTYFDALGRNTRRDRQLYLHRHFTLFVQGKKA